jgi:hypothetical protein
VVVVELVLMVVLHHVLLHLEQADQESWLLDTNFNR